MRSARITWPPASTITTDSAMPACSPSAVAAAMIFFAPAIVRRLLATTYMLWWLRGRSARCRVAAFDDDIFDEAGAAAAKCGGFLVSLRFEAADGGFHGRELDHDEAVENLRSFHDAVAAAAR